MKGRRYFDPCQEVRCWLDTTPSSVPPSADFSAGRGWNRERVMDHVARYAARLREKADLAERWLFVMRYGSVPQKGEAEE